MEKENKELKEQVNGLHWRNKWLESQEQNQRYKQALEFYAKDDIRGEKARQALRGETE